MASNTNVREMIVKNNARKGGSSDKVVPVILGIIAVISILTTISILFTLITETITFSTRVSTTEFLLTEDWNPTSSDSKYGIWALILDTLKTTFIGILVVVPIGLGATTYLSEYASDEVRRIIKPILEILAGIPTTVFGFFALTSVIPLLKTFIPQPDSFSSISPGIAVGIMIVPIITNMSEDAMASVPNKTWEGAFGLDSIKLEVTTKAVLPAAASGVVASIVLGISRAIDETMIISLAAGSSLTSSLTLTSSIQVMTDYAVEIATGDATFGSDIYYSTYAIGFTLFISTLIMNLISYWISKRYREEY